MNILVVDASVALKWFFRERHGESHVEQALSILSGLREERLRLVQPPHFLAEIAAVLAREKPDAAVEDLEDLQAVGWQETEDASALYALAIDLSVRLQRHVFDTLYHAVALQLPDAVLVTADLHYYERAAGIGRVSRLADFDASAR